MSAAIGFTLNGEPVEAAPGETIWQVADRLGIEIPYLCYAPEPGYRADGNCRACMVEIEGERTLAASCIRIPTPGMTVSTASERARKAREMVFELLVADQPPPERAHDPDSKFWRWSAKLGVTSSRFPARDMPAPDASHTAMRVNLDACINCTLCVRACREVQVNDVIGMAYRGHGAKIVFDFDETMGASTCVACGECVQACPTGALMEASLLNDEGLRTGFAEREVDTVCPYCGVGCLVTLHVKDDKVLHVDGRDGPANRNRLCVKGRFGYDYISHPHRLTKPMIRRADAPKAGDIQIDPADPWTHFREASWDEALDAAAQRIVERLFAAPPGALAAAKELIAAVAFRAEVPLEEVERYDERPEHPVARAFRKLLIPAHDPVLIGAMDCGWGVYDGRLADWDETPSAFDEDSCVRVTAEVMRHLAASVNAVLIGRGGQALALGPHVLHVCIVAPEEFRMQTVMERDELGPDQAAKQIRRTDRQRRRYIKRHYGLDWDDARHYDLVLNTGRLGVEGAASIVLDVAEHLPRHPEPTWDSDEQSMGFSFHDVES
ncbi:MAG: cytidylate kinase family protein [Proteobacteria bacterium]|nr:cytidylate kinase family protein [Pseudomonadota bacterium]